MENFIYKLYLNKKGGGKKNKENFIEEFANSSKDF